MIEYRDAQPHDADAVALLHTQSWRQSYRGSFSDAFLDEEQPAERIRVWRARLGRPAANQLVRLAFEGADLVGFVCVYGAHDPQWGSLIDNLHVSSAAKRRGIGASLMRQAGAWLGPLYAEVAIYLFVLEVNAPARRFYEQLRGRNAGVATMETHGGAIVRSCRYVWPGPAALSAARP
jgi:ribosomal protein S18 acetylase RimI-like enzyme